MTRDTQLGRTVVGEGGPAGLSQESASPDTGSDFEPQQDVLTPEEFKLAFRHHAAGVAIVTCDFGDGPVGLTATSVFSVSAEPPLAVFSVTDQASSAPALKRADSVVIHLLSADEIGLAKLFATHGADRFADKSTWERLPTGEPRLLGVPTWVRARLVARMPAGGSTLYEVEAVEFGVDTNRESLRPLIYHNRTWHEISPESALTAP